jgi:hypothetical protein
MFKSRFYVVSSLQVALVFIWPWCYSVFVHPYDWNWHCYTTWLLFHQMKPTINHTAKSISICWESCGGHGYAVENHFGALRNDHDIFKTFEGDNTVLLQQVLINILYETDQSIIFKLSGYQHSVWWADFAKFNRSKNNIS